MCIRIIAVPVASAIPPHLLISPFPFCVYFSDLFRYNRYGILLYGIIYYFAQSFVPTPVLQHTPSAPPPLYLHILPSFLLCTVLLCTVLLILSKTTYDICEIQQRAKSSLVSDIAHCIIIIYLLKLPTLMSIFHIPV